MYGRYKINYIDFVLSEVRPTARTSEFVTILRRLPLTLQLSDHAGNTHTANLIRGVARAEGHLIWLFDDSAVCHTCTAAATAAVAVVLQPPERSNLHALRST